MRFIYGTVAILALLLAGVAHASPVAEFSAPAVSAAAASVPVGEILRIENIPLEEGEPPVTFELERFEIFAPDAKVVIHEAGGDRVVAAPRNAYFRGRVAGQPGTSVYLSALERGEVRGLVASAGRTWVFAQGGSGLEIKETGFGSLLGGDTEDYECSSGQLVSPHELATGLLAGSSAPGTPTLARAAAPAAATEGIANTARLAIETDDEFLNAFGGNTADATDYIGDLMAYSSGIYTAELDTNFQIVHVSLWAGGDPWTQFSTICGLFEFGRYWNDNHSGIDRSLVHFLSGKNNGGGVAWVGALCNSGFNYNHQGSCPGLSPQTDNYGGDYGYSGDLDFNFNPGSPSVVWDVVVTAHEIGHNFGTSHTHCYAGVGGNLNPVDECYGSETGCYSGAASLPCSTPGGGCGTIMSYCHLRGGGLGNISMTFGDGHPWGNAPERVDGVMTSYIATTNLTNPTCLEPTGLIFTDGFESGNVSSWSGTN